jgi:hypothetical protein
MAEPVHNPPTTEHSTNSSPVGYNPDSSCRSLAEQQIRSYRIRRRRKAEATTRQRHLKPKSEDAAVVEFALTWAPYGGATDEETFVRFGMLRKRFARRLREALDNVECDPALDGQLRTIYR